MLFGVFCFSRVSAKNKCFFGGGMSKTESSRSGTTGLRITTHSSNQDLAHKFSLEHDATWCLSQRTILLDFGIKKTKRCFSSKARFSAVTGFRALVRKTPTAHRPNIFFLYSVACRVLLRRTRLRRFINSPCKPVFLLEKTRESYLGHTANWAREFANGEKMLKKEEKRTF